jgi:hypothetical protein
LIEKVSGNRVLDVSTQFLPGIRLRENVIRQTLSHKSAVVLLIDTEDNFHSRILPLTDTCGKPHAERAIKPGYIESCGATDFKARFNGLTVEGFSLGYNGEFQSTLKRANHHGVQRAPALEALV